MTPPYRVGLTGGIGAGKSTVAEVFSKLGVPIIDADKIARQVVEPGKPVLKEIARLFGNKILGHDGTLVRDDLRERVFSNDELRLQLESIIHPLVFTEINNKIKEIRYPYCIIIIPLLLETGAHNNADTILVVDTVESTQIARVVNRDRMSTKHVQDIIKTQISRHDRLKAADDIINNNDDIDRLLDQVQALHLKYLSKQTKKLQV